MHAYFLRQSENFLFLIIKMCKQKIDISTFFIHPLYDVPCWIYIFGCISKFVSTFQNIPRRLRIVRYCVSDPDVVLKVSGLRFSNDFLWSPETVIVLNGIWNFAIRMKHLYVYVDPIRIQS